MPYKENSFKKTNLMLQFLSSIIKEKKLSPLKGNFKIITFYYQGKFLVKEPLAYRPLLCELLTMLKNNGQKLLLLEAWGAAKSKRKKAAATADVCSDVCINLCYWQPV